MKLLSLVPLLAVAYAAESATEDVAAEKPNLDMTANGVKVLPRFEATKWVLCQQSSGITTNQESTGQLTVLNVPPSHMAHTLSQNPRCCRP